MAAIPNLLGASKQIPSIYIIRSEHPHPVGYALGYAKLFRPPSLKMVGF